MATSTFSRHISSPFGDFTVTVTVRGIRQVAFGFLPLIDEYAEPPAAAVELLDRTATQLAEYFSGQRRSFTVPLDLPELPPFQARALAAMQQIGYGQTATYAELAEAAGNAKAARAAGSACAKNPVPIIIPCHRVVPTGGGIGNYGGGSQLKEQLLHFEGHPN